MNHLPIIAINLISTFDNHFRTQMKIGYSTRKSVTKKKKDENTKNIFQLLEADKIMNDEYNRWINE